MPHILIKQAIEFSLHGDATEIPGVVHCDKKWGMERNEHKKMRGNSMIYWVSCTALFRSMLVEGAPVC